MIDNPAELAALYRDNLLTDVIPFWERHSLDETCGGYFTCLARDGTVFDTDKFLWLQARQVWMFSTLYRRVEARPKWLEIARHGADFLQRFGADEEGNWYFSLTREGRPLVQPYNWFTDSFAAIGFAQYALASGSEQARDIAVRTFQNLLRRRDDPKGKYNKACPGVRPLRSLAFPMILINLGLEMEDLIPADERRRLIESSIREIMTLHFDPERRITWDNIAPDGSHPDCFEGRVIIPGHGIEAMWFTMDAVRRLGGDPAIIEPAVEGILGLLEFGWDPEYEGILYYKDIRGFPPEQLQWDQKLWWVHIEALVALAMAWRLTGRQDCRDWYHQVHAYTWQRFPDPAHGEWFGYLNRRGERLMELKGGKWKGCFHVPRGLHLCWREFEAMARECG